MLKAYSSHNTMTYTIRDFRRGERCHGNNADPLVAGDTVQNGRSSSSQLAQRTRTGRQSHATVGLWTSAHSTWPACPLLSTHGIRKWTSSQAGTLPLADQSCCAPSRRRAPPGTMTNSYSRHSKSPLKRGMRFDGARPMSFGTRASPVNT